MHARNIGNCDTWWEVSKIVFHVTPTAKNRSLKYRDTFSLFCFFHF